MFNVGDTVQYNTPADNKWDGGRNLAGWTFKVAKVENGLVYAPMEPNSFLQFNYVPSELKLISKAQAPVMYGVRFICYVGRSKLATAPNRFYSRKHAQEWARAFKARFGLGLIRFQTFSR